MAECSGSVRLSTPEVSVDVDTLGCDGGGQVIDVTEWYKDPRYQRYWRHYEQARRWLQTQCATVEEMSQAGWEYQHWCRAMCAYHSQCAARMQQYSTHLLHTASLYHNQAAVAAVPAGALSTPLSSQGKRCQTVNPRNLQDKASDVLGQDQAESQPNNSQKSKKKKRKRKKKAKLEKVARKKSRKRHLLFSDLEDIPSDIEFVLDLSGDLEVGCGGAECVEYHMEISEDMLEFFAQSAKHKQERGMCRVCNICII